MGFPTDAQWYRYLEREDDEECNGEYADCEDGLCPECWPDDDDEEN